MPDKLPANRPEAEMFRQRKPCSDCPFLKEGGVRHGVIRAMEYARHFWNGSRTTFPCHQSVPKDDPRDVVSEWRKGQTLCAGGLILAEKEGQHCNVVKWAKSQAGMTVSIYRTRTRCSILSLTCLRPT